MTTITIVPAGPRDAAMHQAQYEALRAALESDGYTATVDVGIERRSGVEAILTEIAVHVGEGLVGDALVRLAVQLRQYLRGLRKPPSGDPRTAVIYGPTEEVLSTVELPDDD